MVLTNNTDGEHAYGSGHVDPVKALSPGLVYETSKQDYINFMCDIGFDTNTVRLVSGDNSTCPKNRTGLPKDLNYPSMARKVKQIKPFQVKFPRAVRNVGSANSTYRAIVKIRSPLIKVKVNPSTLSFKSLNETKSFEVIVTGAGLAISKQSSASASLVWSDGHHHVKSPILIYVAKKG